MTRRAWPLLLALLSAPCTAQSAPDLDALIIAGRLDEAAALARQSGDSSVVRLADILVLQGHLAEARAVYAPVYERRGDGWRPAAVGLAELAARRGDAEEAKRLAGEIIAGWQSNRPGWSADDHVAVGRAFLLLADGDPDAVRDALAAFDAATASDPNDVTGELLAADLLLARYNAPDARSGYQAVLARRPGDPRALVGLARAAAFDHQGEPLPLLERALAANPRSVPAHLLLARLYLEAEQYDSSQVAADAALAADSSSLDAWAAVASLAWLRGDSTTWRGAVTAATRLNPRPAAFHAAIAEAAARHRRYAEAAVLARRAVELDSNSVPALGALGTNLLRLGDIAGGRALLERAFALDPYHLWHKNTLDLLDQLATFRVVDRGRFRIVAPPGDAEFLATLLVPLLEEAYDSLAARYDYRPPTPIRVELYDRHADFSVRTIGLTGLGALGVAFGTVLVLDAPQARPAGEFNLGSTAWHELAHTFTLGVSGHRVPRWLSEGLSVLEERRARAGWGAHVSVGFVQALAAGDLLPIARLNDGFVRPDRPERIGLSYYQASLVVEFLEQRHGIAGIRGMLRGYAEGMTTDAVLARLSGESGDALQRRFDEWLADRFAAPIEAIAAGEPTVFGTQLTVAREALTAGDTAVAVRLLRLARDRFPEHGGDDGPRVPLALVAWQQGARSVALEELQVVTHQDETALAANRLEATWHLEIGDTAGALAALRRATWIAPGEIEPWRARAEVAAALGDHPDAVLARRAVMALRPSDPVAARTDLAAALLRAGDPASARRELLTVLEQAPGYERAQGLLLEARRGRATP